MTRDDLRQFLALDIDFETIGLAEPGAAQEPYFCTPVGAEYVGRLGADGIHFILLPGDERVYCVSPMGAGEDRYVWPVAEDFRTFLSYLLYCRDVSPLEQISWMDEGRFHALLEKDAQERWPGCEEFFARKEAALRDISGAFDLTPVDPYDRVKALQASFDPSVLRFSEEYYELLGDEPGQPQ